MYIITKISIKWDDLTLVQQENTLSNRKIYEIQLTQLYDPIITQIIQKSLPIWIILNDIHITRKIRKTQFELQSIITTSKTDFANNSDSQQQSCK